MKLFAVSLTSASSLPVISSDIGLKGFIRSFIDPEANTRWSISNFCNTALKSQPFMMAPIEPAQLYSPA